MHVDFKPYFINWMYILSLLFDLCFTLWGWRSVRKWLRRHLSHSYSLLCGLGLTVVASKETMSSAVWMTHCDSNSRTQWLLTPFPAKASHLRDPFKDPLNPIFFFSFFSRCLCRTLTRILIVLSSLIRVHPWPQIEYRQRLRSSTERVNLLGYRNV